MWLVNGRSLFIIESGKVEISTLVTQQKDEVALMTGEELPYIIRRSLDLPGI